VALGQGSGDAAAAR